MMYFSNLSSLHFQEKLSTYEIPVFNTGVFFVFHQTKFKFTFSITQHE